MKKIILILSVLCLISCKQEIKLNEENHLQLFNLKGKVKQINYNYILNEITDITYKPIGKSNPSFFDLGSIGYVDLSYIKAQSNFDFYYSGLFFDSYNISLGELLTKSYDAKKCDNYEVTFNTDGYVTSLKGFKDKLLLTNTSFIYNDKKITKIIKREGFADSELYSYDIEYKYNEYNLISEKRQKYLDGYSSNSTFDYQFNKEKNEFNIKENKTEIFNGKKKERNSELKYKLVLNNENKIEEIIYEKETKSVKFSNGRIKKRTEFNKENELTFNIELGYDVDKISDVKITRYGKLNEISFDYEDNGNLKKVNCNNESNNDYLSNLKFIYEFDNFNNWTKQSYSIDRTKYDNYLQYLKKREKYSNDYYELYGYSPFSFQEDVDAEIERKLLSKYSSKIDVERRIIYY